MAARYTNLMVILDRILRDSLFTGLTYEAVLDYYIDFAQIVGVPNTYDKKMSKLVVTNFRAALPTDFMELEQILLNNIPARSATDTAHNFYKELNATTNFGESSIPNPIRKTVDFTFSIQGDVIYTSIEKGEAIITYKAIPTIDGFPAIPDDANFIRALTSYVEREFLTILWRNGKISDKIYDDAKQKYAWAVGSYETSSRQLSLDKAESLYNMFSTLLIRNTEFQNRFRNLGSKEFLKKR